MFVFLSANHKLDRPNWDAMCLLLSDLTPIPAQQLHQIFSDNCIHFISFCSLIIYLKMIQNLECRMQNTQVYRYFRL